MLQISRLPILDSTIARNQKRRGDHRCIICQAPVNVATALPVYVHKGGGHIVTEAEYDELELTESGSGLGTQYIGRDCYRNHRSALMPYLNGGVK